MPKKIISDMIITKRTIREIPVSKKKTVESDDDLTIKNDSPRINHPSIRRRDNWQRKPLNPKFVIWTIAVLCILALFFGISILFSSATLIINPRTETVSFTSDRYTVKPKSSKSTGLTFETLEVEQTKSLTVVATEEKDVNKKASGTIIIYNNYSSAPQRLINNTRFESTNGKVYRINNSIVVPGTKNVDGKVVPGSVEAIVFADQAGEGYNLSLSELAGDFKIPGFKGDPRYEKFYARLKTDIVGGFIGKQLVVDPALREKTELILKEELRQELIKELYALKPDNFLFFKEGYSLSVSGLPDVKVNDNQVQINMQGKLLGIIFNNQEFANFISLSKISNYDSLPVEFMPQSDFTLSLKTIGDANISKDVPVEVTLNGQAIIKWVYDGGAIKKDLAGRKKSELESLVLKHKNLISGIQVILRPVWTRYFPDDIDKIRIKEEIKTK